MTRQQRLSAAVHGTGQPVVLLHGQPGSGSDWDRVVPLLRDSFEVIVPDRPGYGATGGEATGFAGNAEAVVGLLDRLGVASAIAAGHSWGGGVALALAEAHPARVCGLVLVASVAPGEPVGWDDRLLAAPFIGEAIAAVTIGIAGRVLGMQGVQALADRRLGGTALEAVRTVSRLTGAHSGARVWRSFVSEQRCLIAELDALGPGLSALRVPAAVLNGSADRVVPPAVADALSSALQGASHTVVEGAGHLLLHLHPAAVAEAVREVAGRASGDQTAR